MSGDIALMMSLALFTSVGMFMTVAACGTSQTAWPLLSAVLFLMAMVPIFCCGLARNSMDSMPSYLQESGYSEGVPSADVGWFVTGLLSTAAVSCPLILARFSVIDMRASWFSSIGCWFTALAVGAWAIFMIKGSATD